MAAGFLGLAVLLALWNWVAIWRKGPAWMEYITKPGTLLALLAWIGASGGLIGERLPFTVGLGLGLVGDILLMLPKSVVPNHFILGLFAFLLGHLAYILGLNPQLPPVDLAVLAVLILVSYSGYRLFQRLIQGMQRSHQIALRWPALAYMLAICSMVASALLTLVRPEWQTWAAISMASGAILFLLSDAWLAWSKFIAPQPQPFLRVRVTYHLAQFLIASAVLQQFQA